MKWFGFILAVGIAFLYGFQLGSSRLVKKVQKLEGIRHEFSELSNDELKDYLNLKDQKMKYDKANEILAKIMQIFIADLGLHSAENQVCKINSGELSVPAALTAPISPIPNAKKRLRKTQPVPESINPQGSASKPDSSPKQC